MSSNGDILDLRVPTPEHPRKDGPEPSQVDLDGRWRVRYQAAPSKERRLLGSRAMRHAFDSRRALRAAFFCLEAMRAKALTPESCLGWVQAALDLTRNAEALPRFRASWGGFDKTAFDDLLATEHEAALATLRGLLNRPQDITFVKAAFLAGQIQRRDALIPGWEPVVDGTESLSRLAALLLACDIVDHRRDYLFFSVCDGCGRVGFVDDERSRRSCRKHSPSVPPLGKSPE